MSLSMTRFEQALILAVSLFSFAVAGGFWPDARRDERLQQVIAGLKSSDPSQRGRAYGDLRRFGPGGRAAAPELIEQLDNGRNTEAINALLAIGPGGTLDPLMGALKEKQTAIGAATMIGLFGPAARRARPALLGALEDSDVRVYAEQALQAIDGRDVYGRKATDRRAGGVP
jgi:hypothetical protein